jgi:hypothetical protein
MIKSMITCFYRNKSMAKLMATPVPQCAVRTAVLHLAASGGIMTTCYSQSHNTGLHAEISVLIFSFARNQNSTLPVMCSNTYKTKCNLSGLGYLLE